MNEEIEKYEERLKTLESEKHERTKETVQNLEDLLEELSYIEKINEDLNTQMEQANKQKGLLNEQLETSAVIIEKLTVKIDALEKDQRSTFKNIWPSQILTGCGCTFLEINPL
jgi:predicted RNase H-like nuclease (RuvC/YqgF family)